jgi:hypothetical protein
MGGGVDEVVVLEFCFGLLIHGVDLPLWWC